MELEITPDQEFFAETTAAVPRRARAHVRSCGTCATTRRVRTRTTGSRAPSSAGRRCSSPRPTVAAPSPAAPCPTSRSSRTRSDGTPRPGPLVPTNVVAGALSRWGTDEQKESVLAGLLAGDVIAAWCHDEPGRPHRLGDVAVGSGAEWRRVPALGREGAGRGRRPGAASPRHRSHRRRPDPAPRAGRRAGRDPPADGRARPHPSLRDRRVRGRRAPRIGGRRRRAAWRGRRDRLAAAGRRSRRSSPRWSARWTARSP